MHKKIWLAYICNTVYFDHMKEQKGSCSLHSGTIEKEIYLCI